MKKIIWVGIVLGLVAAQHAVAGSAVDYVIAVENINEQYKKDSRQFFASLNPQQSGFTAQQQAQFCQILWKYANGLYAAADENRAFLDREYRQISKVQVIDQVLMSKEMQMLKKYNVQCDLK